MEKKRKASTEKIDFMKKLIEMCMAAKGLRPNEIYIFNVFAKHGCYQIMIGPEYPARQCKERHLAPHSRRLEINGSLYNLFVSPKEISATPKHEDVKMNLRGSVIMKNVLIHIVEKSGDGAEVEIRHHEMKNIQVRRRLKFINHEGEDLVKKHKASGQLAKETYRIIREDILSALTKKS